MLVQGPFDPDPFFGPPSLPEARDLDGPLEREMEAQHMGPLVKGSPQEPAVIRAALAKCGGNVARATRRLGVPRGTLRYRIRKYSLDHLIPKD